MKFWYFIVIFSFQFDLWAQEPLIRNYNTSDNLTSNECYRILQDKKGYIWVSSDAGLDRFNGHTFLHYTKEDGLPDNVIINLILDNEGCLWMSGLNSQVAYWENDSFHSPGKLNDFLKSNVKKSVITSMRRVNDELQLGFDENYSKILIYSLSKKTIKVNSVDAESLTIFSDPCGSIYSQPSNPNLAPSFDLDLVVINDKNKKSKIHIPYVPYCGFAVPVGEDSVLVSAGEHIYLLHNGKFEYFHKAKSTVLWIYKDSRNNIWVAVRNNGLLLMNAQKLKKTEIKQLYPNYSFSSITEDSEHSIWLSSLNRGIYQIPNPAIRIYKHNENTTFNLTTVARYNKKILAGGANNKIYEVTAIGLLPFLSLDELGIIEIKDIKAVAGNLIVGANASFTVKHDKMESYSINPIIINSKQKTFISYIASNKTDSLLCYLGNRNWFAEYNIKTGYLGDEKRIPSIIYSIYSDSLNRIYIGSLLGLYKLENDSVVFLGKNNPLLNTRINYINKKQTVFVFSTKENGIVFWDGKKCWSINYKDGLPSNDCYKTMFVTSSQKSRQM